MHIPQLPVNHPWYFLSSIALPNVKWCEETLMGWVTEPANTFSNLAYIFVGLMLWQRSRKSEHPFLRLYAPMAVALGLLSGLYHASYNFITQLGDFAGMYWVGFIPLFINLERSGIKLKNPMKTYWMLSIGLTLLTIPTYMMNIPIQGIVLVNIIAVVFMELRLYFQSGQQLPIKNFLIGMSALFIGATFSALDATRTMCDPTNHVVQGHALWHCFTSMMSLFVFWHYQEVLEGKPVLSKAIA